MRLFYLAYPPAKISETLSRKSQASQEPGALSRTFTLAEQAPAFPLSWSHYVMLVKRACSPEARMFYETEAEIEQDLRNA